MTLHKKISVEVRIGPPPSPSEKFKMQASIAALVRLGSSPQRKAGANPLPWRYQA